MQASPSPTETFPTTGGLDLNSPTTKQAMLRLGIKKSEVLMPSKTSPTYKGKNERSVRVLIVELFSLFGPYFNDILI